LRTRTRLSIFCAVALVPLLASADGTLVSWSGSEMPGMTKERWERAKQLSSSEVLERNLKVATWAECYELALGSKAHKADEKFLRALAAQILDPGATQLSETKSLIIWERISRGEILFLGKGLQIDDDLFRVAGRANWLLRLLRERDFGHVTPDSKPADLEALHGRWLAHLSGGAPPEWKNPYPTDQQGFSEIRSKAALGALIVSLAPSPAKDTHTATCLRSVYGLDQLPDDPSAPAQLCSPDPWIHRYLAALTPETSRHDAAWWNDWWKRNAATLRWDAAQGRFSPGS
jgi:hypothetical protein